MTIILNKKLGIKKLRASIAINNQLEIPYTRSQVFSEFDDKTGELYILIKDTATAKEIKLFFKDDEKIDVVNDKANNDAK